VLAFLLLASGLERGPADQPAVRLELTRFAVLHHQIAPADIVAVEVDHRVICDELPPLRKLFRAGSLMNASASDALGELAVSDLTVTD
jgi:hypothetical protein